ncbi:hypothetical protein ABZS86_12985 [Streptomyces sp. NPDC005355]|uniref:hypothetical protein n=1 Tax=Streptomyces sp. NPDC005355 TaxID=3157038 RepID=UPI00339FE43C
MTDNRTPDGRTPDGRSVEAGIATMEGYLLWQAEIERTRTEAQAFVDALDWPTTAQREELVDLLARRQLDLSRMIVSRIAARALQLREEYQHRYEHLKRRVVAYAVAAVAVLVFLNVLLLTS